VCGDFNSHKKWDHERKVGNHSAVVELLRGRNLVSAYHTFFSEEQGEETRNTHFNLFSEDERKWHHVDYIFIPESWAIGINVELGTYEDWGKTKRSDHAPLAVDVAENTQPWADA
jgi:endonuclease/exonuclease/phosphatase family metal-dependent hydrolase